MGVDMIFGYNPCCGMALRATPTSRRDKEKLRQNQRLRLLLTTNE